MSRTTTLTTFAYSLLPLVAALPATACTAVDDPAYIDHATAESISAQPFECTRVIGYSQTNQWFFGGGGLFETYVDDDAWEVLATGGAHLERYRKINSYVWDEPVKSPCAGNGSPDRVLLNIAGPYATDAEWQSAINDTIDNIRMLYPNVREIVLQPVVGGPSEIYCWKMQLPTAQLVQATVSHIEQDEAIALATRPRVVAGASPEVLWCEHYKDTLGHLTDAGSAYAGEQLGLFYQNF